MAKAFEARRFVKAFQLATKGTLCDGATISTSYLTEKWNFLSYWSMACQPFMSRPGSTPSFSECFVQSLYDSTQSFVRRTRRVQLVVFDLNQVRKFFNDFQFYSNENLVEHCVQSLDCKRFGNARKNLRLKSSERNEKCSTSRKFEKWRSLAKVPCDCSVWLDELKNWKRKGAY